MSFTLDVFCDWAIELSKPAIFEGGESKQRMVSVLAFAFEQTLKLLHPFIPYVTEYIYQNMDFVDKIDSIMISQYADLSKFENLKNDAIKTDELIALIVALRKFKIDNGKKSSDKVEFKTKETEFAKVNKAVIEKMAIITLSFDDELEGKTLVTANGDYVLVEEKIDVAVQIEILNKDIEKVNFEIIRSEKMLNNPAFMAKAPENLVKAETEKLAKNKEMLTALTEKLNGLK